MIHISKILIKEGSFIIIACDNNVVFVFETTTRRLTKINFDFGRYIDDIISLGNNTIAIVSKMIYSKHRVNIFGLSKTEPPQYLFSLESDRGSQETTVNINSEKSLFVTGSYSLMLRSYSYSSDRTFTSLGSIKVPRCSSSGIKIVRSHPRIPNLVFVVVGKTIFQYRMTEFGEFEFLAGLSGHPSWINSLEISLDGTMMVSCSSDPNQTDTIIVWKINGLEPAVLTQILRGHTMTVNSVAFSHDGTVLASGSSDETIRIWEKDGDEWICKQVLGEPNSGPNCNFINAVVFDPTDPTLLISGSSTGQVVVWILSDGVWMRESEIVIEK